MLVWVHFGTLRKLDELQSLLLAFCAHRSRSAQALFLIEAEDRYSTQEDFRKSLAEMKS